MSELTSQHEFCGLNEWELKYRKAPYMHGLTDFHPVLHCLLNKETLLNLSSLFHSKESSTSIIKKQECRSLGYG